MSERGKTEVEIQVLTEGVEPAPRTDRLAVEEPLEVRLGDEPVAVLMRSPGQDMELALGLLFSEGILQDPDQVLSVAYCSDTTEEAAGNVVRVLAEGADRAAFEKAQRSVYASSSCGLCGKATIDAVRLMTPKVEPIGPLSRAMLSTLPERVRGQQPLFDETGGVHAAALFSATGELLLVREDIGRHNACDKILGAMALREVWPLSGKIMVLSGRASFEMVQKAAMAGIGAIVAVSAPSSMAVNLAREHGMALIGFARGDSMNLYSGEICE